MSEQLLQKMVQLIDQDLKEIDMQLHWLQRQKAKETDLLIEKVELLRARKEIERELSDLHGEEKEIQKGIYPTLS
jgi:alcohol dehydrogenase class IV